MWVTRACPVRLHRSGVIGRLSDSGYQLATWSWTRGPSLALRECTGPIGVIARSRYLMDDLRPFSYCRLREPVAVDGAISADHHGRSPPQQAHEQKYAIAIRIQTRPGARPR